MYKHFWVTAPNPLLCQGMKEELASGTWNWFNMLIFASANANKNPMIRWIESTSFKARHHLTAEKKSISDFLED